VTVRAAAATGICQTTAATLQQQQQLGELSGWNTASQHNCGCGFCEAAVVKPGCLWLSTAQ